MMWQARVGVLRRSRRFAHHLGGCAQPKMVGEPAAGAAEPPPYRLGRRRGARDCAGTGCLPDRRQ